MKFVLMGAPGCGKGTQSPFITERYDVCHLSTGDMLREAVARGTEFGAKAKATIESGNLVSDEIVFGILKESMSKPECKNGFVLDGFPRTLRQAEMMEDAGVKVDQVIAFDVPDDVIVTRTSGRWIHRGSGRTYHEVFCPPKVQGRDDVTGEALIQRPDDRKEIAVKRLEVYHKEMAPLIDFYKTRGVFSHINANRPVDAVRESLRAILDPIARSFGWSWDEKKKNV